MESINELIQQRIDKLNEIREKGMAPYGGKFARTAIKDIVADFQEDKTVAAAGRIMASRGHGKSIFADLNDGSGKVQVYVKKDRLGEESFDLFKNMDIGDIIGVEGKLFKTRTEEVTINVEKFVVLAKGLRPLPEKWHGLKDVETRYRCRYLDLIMSQEVKDVFLTRSRLISSLRKFLDGKGFLEVETPMMQSIAGGATAKPFVTHHNALGIDLFLRVAPELYLKRLLVGGLEKVYEVNRNFRNEGISTRHNPEFTMLEVYAAYCDYEDMMDLCEEIISGLAQEVLGKTVVEYQGQEIDFKRPWRRVPLFDLVKEHTGIDCRRASDAEVLDAARKAGLDPEKGAGREELVNSIFEHAVEPKLVQPCFVTDYPASLCPLSKRKPDDPELTERFELFIAGQELANAYSELNDPIDQKERFEEQARQNPESKPDMDFVTALEYGMPPAGGLGIGIDRLVMILANQASIRDVILFPQLKPVQSP